MYTLSRLQEPFSSNYLSSPKIWIFLLFSQDWASHCQWRRRWVSGTRYPGAWRHTACISANTSITPKAGWCDDTLWVVLFLLFSKHLDLAAARIRYIIRVRNVKGGGSSESGSKNWIAKFNREYLKIFKIKLNKINFPNIFKNSKYPVLLGLRRSHI